MLVMTLSMNGQRDLTDSELNYLEAHGKHSLIDSDSVVPIDHIYTHMHVTAELDSVKRIGDYAYFYWNDGEVDSILLNERPSQIELIMK